MADDLEPPVRSPRRRAVYSALIGDYETITPRPTEAWDDVDFYFFSDAPGVDPGDGWALVLVEPHLPSDTVRSARRLKTCGHSLLDSYDEILWVDNRIVLKGDPNRLFDLLGDFDIAFPTHSFRERLRDEFTEVIAAGYDDPERVRLMYDIAEANQMLDLEPLWTGLYLRRNCVATRAFGLRWFDYLLLTSRRDQLSVQVAASDTALRVRHFELDNIESGFHTWVDAAALNRKRAVQIWRRKPRRFQLRAADLMRSAPFGRQLARALTRLGVPIATTR